MQSPIQLQPALVAALAVCLGALNAVAAPVTYSTNVAGTGFTGTGLTLNSSSGVAATLTYAPNANETTGVPSQINLGNFILVCSACTTQAGGAGSFFSPFTFNLVITDVTDGGTGRFVGTSTGGTVFGDVSQLTINWAPLQLGPGTSNALTGSFGNAIFTTTVFTGIVAPNSGSIPGQSTVQGAVAFATIPDAVPEPAALGLVGIALAGIGFIRRRKVQ